MMSLWQTHLGQVAARTFEELCFLLPDDELTDVQRRASIDAAVQVTFCGAFHGALVLRLSSVLLPGITANMLGEMAPPSEEQQDDAVAEIANIICGNILPRIAGPHAVFQLRAPQHIEPRGEGPIKGASRWAEVCFGFDQGRVEVALFAAPDAESFIEGARS